MGKFARSKGIRAERAVIDLLQPVIDAAYGERPDLECPKLQRNTLQADGGGFDIVGIDMFALEVKHQETLHLDQWWAQCWRQAKDHQIPVLLYKRSRIAWRARMIGSISEDGIKVETIVDIDVDSFLAFFDLMLRKELSLKR